MTKLLRALLVLILALTLPACGDKQRDGSSLLQIDDSRDGYVAVTVNDPWKKGHALHTYILVPRDRELPPDLPPGTVVRTPLRNVLVYSDVHARPIDEIGCATAIRSVCDATYFKTPAIVEGLKSGTVTDCGSAMSPSAEKIAGASPEAIILSPMENAGYGILENLGIPIIEMADYMESTPLERAKWIEFIGLLFGKEDAAKAIYEKVEREYKELSALTAGIKQKPSVISETVISGVWYVPGGRSYKATLWRDAGAAYPWADDKSSGSLSLDFPQVLDKAQNADFWLVTVYGQRLTKESMLQIYPHNDRFRAYSHKGVYYVDSSRSPIFEETPFHPERLLKEYIKLFHPGLLPDYTLKYYKPMEE